ncbi:hypothetical protein [Streptomyces sp. NPDC047108]|uniref:hypothetical protein n=1 Tax=Streptomyces sp. NPDC047108 TaxID=3155025 RepID=UPI003400CAFB
MLMVFLTGFGLLLVRIPYGHLLLGVAVGAAALVQRRRSPAWLTRLGRSRAP